MTDVTPWQATLIVLGTFSVAMAFLEAVTRGLAPPKPDDPRLGVLAFWLWVFVVGLVTYAMWPFFEIADGLAHRISFAVWSACWIAWKSGLAPWWEDTPREKEEAWATAVGIFIAGLVRGFWS